MMKRGGNHERTIRELHILEGGVKVGEPLKEFQGILTGVPIVQNPAIPAERRP